jgi:hypothetical protein
MRKSMWECQIFGAEVKLTTHILNWSWKYKLQSFHSGLGEEIQMFKNFWKIWGSSV